MQIPELDSRTAEELRSRIMTLAESYTPEWKANPADPDVGMTLAELFVQMHVGTVRRLNRTAEKNRIAFCNFLGTNLRPSEVATGYVQFGLSSAQLKEGVLVPAGTVLTANMPEDVQNAGFTTVDDVYVSNAKLTHMFVTDGETDTIQEVYSSERDGSVPDFVLFGSQAPNQNRHAAYIGCQNGLLRLIGAGQVLIQFQQEGKTTPGLAEELDRAWHNGQLQICYSTKTGWEPFNFCMADGNTLLLSKELSQPPAAEQEIDGVSAHWIRLTLSEIGAVSSSAVQQLAFASVGESIVPDAVLTNYGAVDDVWFRPFGDVPALFDALYIASDEALSKAGARVSMQFTVSFSPLPETKKVEKPATSWKMVMRKSDVHVEEPEIVQIEAVSWEYFNGTGWKTLPCSGELKKAFSPVDGTRTYTLSFLCPPDVQPVIVGSEERRFLRARIVRMNQHFQLNTIYHMPLVSHIVFQYRCDAFAQPDQIMTENQMRRLHHDNNTPLMLFTPMPQLEPAWYLGFSEPLSEGPHRILVALEQQSSGMMPGLRWEYYSENCWKPLNCYDDTGQFAHTGCLTISGNLHFQSVELFQQERYWIRVTDTLSAYSTKNIKQARPHIIRMDMNCTEIQNRRAIQPEYFSLPTAKPNCTCQLSEKNVCEAAVWVNELELHSHAKTAELLRQGKAEPEYDAYGVMQRLWVRWTPVESFFVSQPDDRYYQIDYNEGIVTFGDGVHGRIPCSSSGDHIRICYSIGGGSCGNVPAGTVSGSQFALGLVTEITNPMPLYGGNDMEQLSAALQRTAADFQNGGRCVTAQDYEEITRRTERSILKVKCIAGYNAEGAHERGSVTILILRSDFSQESSGFYLVQEKLRREIQSRCAASLSPNKCYIIHPHYIRICVTARVLVADSSRMFRMKEQILQKVAAFLHPITGNFDGDGWEIGEIPNWRQIENAIRSIRGVSYVESLMMRAFTVQGQEQVELDLNHLTAAAFCIAISGEHSVQVESSTQIYHT